MMRLGQQQLMETATNPDYRLEHLVNSCDELRETSLIHGGEGLSNGYR